MAAGRASSRWGALRLARVAFALAFVLATACGSGDDGGTRAPGLAPSPNEPATGEPASGEPAAGEPAAGEPATGEPATGEPASEDPAPASPTDPPAAAPATGCALDAPVRLPLAASWTDVAAHAGGFLVLGTRPGGGEEHLFLARVEAGQAPRTLVEIALERPVPEAHRRASPLLEVSEGRVVIALVDGAERLLVATFDPARPLLALRPVAEGVSLRFRPALAPVPGGWLLAWTDDRATPMRVHALRLDADARPVGTARDLTPLAGGAAAPAAVLGASPARLVFVDPRAATSVALRSDLVSEGAGPAEVARPIGLVAQPPELAAIRLGQEDFLAYTGIGNLATTAVGLVRLVGTDAPRSLVEGRGYGVLHLDLAPIGEGALVALDVPEAAPPSSPRRVELRALSRAGEPGEPLLVRARADRGRVAAGPGGAIAVTFHDAGASYVVTGRCAVE